MTESRCHRAISHELICSQYPYVGCWIARCIDAIVVSNLRRDPRHGMRRWACRPYMGDMNTPCHLDITSQISFAHDSLRCRHPILAVIGSGIYVAAPRKADRIIDHHLCVMEDWLMLLVRFDSFWVELVAF